MSDLTKLTIAEARDNLKKGEFTSVELTKAHLVAMEKAQDLNAYIVNTPEIALKQAETADKKIKSGSAGLMEGIPVAVKDLFCTKGVSSTACSHILDGFVPQYESTVSQKLLDAGSVMLGKTNQDEFAMGSANLTSYYGPVKNPWDKNTVPGGSSGGSASAVAAHIAMGALGSDTGGSIRRVSLLVVSRMQRLCWKPFVAMTKRILLLPI
jgi:aspartyl-tRNA(Asn)/glutamyl-tRNA(Gln) amidotransferase subunit A